MGRSQMNHPKASPLARVEQEVGLSKITVVYSRPAARGRFLFGNRPNGNPGLVPYGRIWRVGANESTKITFDTDVYVQDSVLVKGSYALYAFPEADTWQIVFHTNTTHWGDGRTEYDANEDALRIKVTPRKASHFQENFAISFDEITHNGVQLFLKWGDVEVVIPIRVDTKQLMDVQIQEQLNGNATAQTYYEIARYYQEQGTRQELALEYVNTALEMNGSTYYYHKVKSLVLADLGRYTEAMNEATTSKELAEKEGKDEFVRLNEENLRKWNALWIKK